jgi:RNA polymerase sigma-70 factor (ECF subfamily)
MVENSPNPAPPEPPGGDRTERFVGMLLQGEFEIRAAIFTLCPHQADADDLWQRTSTILWRKFGEWRPETDFVAWACTVARFEVKNFLRTRSRDRLCFDETLIESLGDTRAQLRDELAAQRDALAQCVQKLKPDDRRIIDHCYTEGTTTIKAAAITLGMQLNTVYKALIRIRRKLLECTEKVLAIEGRRL